MGLNSSDTISINDNRQEVLDRYRQHTQHCRSCSTALKTVQRLLEHSTVVAGVALAYDLCYPAWDEEQVQQVADWLASQTALLVKGTAGDGWNPNPPSNWNARARGATMQGTFITPSGVTLKFIPSETGGMIQATGRDRFIVVMTVQSGTAPEVEVLLTQFNPQIQVGNQTIEIIEDKIVLKSLKEGAN
ncbi:MAG: hypothetical protein RID09_04510 [Coleofasciculus sp. G1-WW12-02]|uniref:hypothetical protein n=1 Tax=Coleofasciculus sp. G1-WW12-02 TaxID=3068483 RepID=UPI0032FDC96F